MIVSPASDAGVASNAPVAAALNVTVPVMRKAASCGA